jgi:hypothetical protein
MADDPTPIRTLEMDLASAMRMQPGDRSLVDGHVGHWLLEKRFESNQTSAWLSLRCSCGQVLGGEIPRRKFEAAEAPG